MSDDTAMAAEAPPDWSRAAADVCCPLCDYNLRGLTEPRCPECGYRFAWAEVLSPPPTHPYLFECHPRRNVWSFWRTQLGGYLPRRFWRTLRPEVRLRPARLAVYWLLTLALFAAAGAPRWVLDVDVFVRDRASDRARIGRNLASATPAARAGYLRQLVPPWYTADFARHLFRYGGPLGAEVAAAIGFACWPWVTFAALQVFVVSMRGARLRRGHVLRCVLYSCDVGLLAGLAVPVVIRVDPVWEEATVAVAMIGGLLLAVHTTVRLAAAYKLYLRFHRPVLTAMASQVITFLVAVKAAFWLTGY